MIPYGKQSIDEDDIVAVISVLRSDFLTQGPMVDVFEKAFADKVGARYAVAVNSGTAALHAAMVALGIGPGDEVIVPAITFTATANSVLFAGGTPVFADVTTSGHINPEHIREKITEKTKAVIAVDYAGWPCDYERILALCKEHGLELVCDACHAPGAMWNERPVGTIGTLNTFSFHPVKHIATGEGGMITTDNEAMAETLRIFRTHGITKDASTFKGLTSRLRQGYGGQADRGPVTSDYYSSLGELGPWHYEMHMLGYNYRMSDINSALGVSQLKKLDRFVARRREIAQRYYEGLNGLPFLSLPVSDLTSNDDRRTTTDDRRMTNDEGRRTHNQAHSFHLFPVQIDFAALQKTRTDVMAELRALGVGTQVHYIPVCLQPFYRDLLGVRPGDYPGAEAFFARELSIPMYPAMTDDEVQTVIEAMKKIMRQ